MTEMDCAQLMEQIRQAILAGNLKDTQNLVTLALQSKVKAMDIVRLGIVPAMASVGKAYEEQADFPKLLLSARAMKKSLGQLEPLLEKKQDFYIGTALIGTIEGDLHDLGKNIVATMLKSVGIRVIDLGVDVTEKQFLKGIKANPQVGMVCISSLLSTNVEQMRKAVSSIRKMDKESKICIMVGGGCMTQEIADSIGADLYTNDAVEAANKAQAYFAR